MTAVQNIEITDLREAAWNSRKTFDEASLQQFAESIRQHGITPLIVRPLSLSEFNSVADAERVKLGVPIYEIIAGHRRFRAAKLLGLEELPCNVRNLDDVAARELGIVDNLQREDVPALEEGDAYEELRQRLGTPEAIAARVGKDVAYVTKRLQLVSLGELQRKALAERLITVDHALLLARLGLDEQDVNLKWTLDRHAGVKVSLENVIADAIKRCDRKPGPNTFYPSYWEPETVKALQAHIEQGVGRKLSRAPWNLDNAELLKDAPACSACPSNTKANTALFEDLAIQAATCANGHCFEQKRAAFVQIKLATIPKQNIWIDPPKGSALNGHDVYIFPLKVSWKSTSVEPRAQRKGLPDRDGFNPDQVFRYGQWIDAKKGSCEFAREAVTVDWSDADQRGFMGDGAKVRKPGQVITVCVSAKCKVHRKGWQKQRSSERNGQHDAAAQKAQQEKLRQQEIDESKLRIGIASQVVEKLAAFPIELVRASLLGTIPGWPDARRPIEALVPGFEKTLKTAKTDSAEFARATAAVLLGKEMLAPQYWSINPEGRAMFLAAMKVLGYVGPDPWAPAKPEEPKARLSEKVMAIAKNLRKKPSPAKKAAKHAAKKAPAKKAARKGGK